MASPPPSPDSFDALLHRIQGEYTEMPGLRLTAEQGVRLWGLDRAGCEALLRALVERGFLSVGPDGSYGRPSELTSSTRPRMVKAALPVKGNADSSDTPTDPPVAARSGRG